MLQKKWGIFIIFIGLILSGLYAQNEASKDFVEGTVLARQAGSGLDKFPKMEIGFVGRNTDTNEPMAFLFFRLQSALETGGGVFRSFFQLNNNTKQLDQVEGNSFRQFISLLSQFGIICEIAQMRKTTSIDMELGEIELMDFNGI